MLETHLQMYIKQTKTKSENSYVQKQGWMFSEKLLTLSEEFWLYHELIFRKWNVLGNAAPGATREWWLTERDYYTGFILTAAYSTSVQQRS